MADRRVRLHVDVDQTGDLDGSEFDKLANSADKADGSLRRMSKGQQVLQSEIDKTRGSIKGLRDEFSRTGDLGLLKDADKLEANLKRLQNQFRKVVPDDDPNVGRGLFDRLGRGFADVSKQAAVEFKNLPTMIGDSIAKNPVISTALIGGVVGAAPFIVSAVSAAVGTGVALGFAGGGIATGIIRASKDSGVRSAWADLATVIGNDLDSASGRFVEPLIHGAEKVEAAWNKIFPSIDAAMQALAPTLDALFTGVQGFITNLKPGIEALTDIGTVLAQDFADFLPELGQAFSGFFQSIEKAGPQIRAFFNDFMDLSLQAVSAVGFLVEKGAKLYEVFAGVGTILTGQFSAGVQRLIDAGHEGTASFGGFHNTTIETSKVLGLLNGTMEKTADGQVRVKHGADAIKLSFDQLFASMSAISNATLGFNEALLQFKAGVEANGATLDIHTQKGINNTRMLEAAIGKIVEWRQANDNGATSAAYLNAEVERQTGEFRQAATAAGFNRDQVDALIRKYLQVPGEVRTNIDAPGLAYNKALAEGYRAVLESINGRVVTSTIVSNNITRYTTIYGTSVENQGSVSQVGGARVIARQFGGIVAAAKGMIANMPTVVFGEGRGPEAYIPRDGISQQRGENLVKTAANWYGMPVGGSGYGNSVGVGGGRSTPTEVKVIIQDDSGRMIRVLRTEIRGRGGNVQKILGKGD